MEAFHLSNPFQKRRGHDQKIVVTAGTQEQRDLMRAAGHLLR
jgi:hypothetical protein